MTTLDTPINEQAVVDTPIEATPVNKTTESLDDFKALKAAYIDHFNTGKPLVEGYREHRASFNMEGDLQQLSKEKLAQDNADASTAIEEIISEQPGVYSDALEAELELRAEREEKAKDPTRQFVDAVSTVSTTPEQITATENYIKLYELYQEATADIGTLEQVGDFLLDIVPFVATSREAATFGSVLNNEELLNNIILTYKKKSFEDQQRLFPQLAEDLIEGLGSVRGKEALLKFIEPSTENELGDFSNWWKVADVVDIASLGATAAIKAAHVAKAFNLPKTLAKAGNEGEAGKAVAASLADDEVAKAANISKETAFGDAVAFDISLVDPAYTKGLSTASLDELKGYMAVADTEAEKIIRGEGYIKEGILNTVERAAKETAALDRLQNAKHEEITIAGRTENTTKFKYKAVDEEGNYFDEEFELDLTLNDVGQWTQDEISILSEFIASPTVFAKGLTRLDVNTAQRLDDQTAKVFRALTGLQKEAVSGLGNLVANPKARASLAKVDKALRDGDEWFDEATNQRGKVFTPDELISQYGFEQKEMVAYYKTNRLYNNLWRLRNNSKREEMIARDYKQINLLDEETSFGKAFDTEGSAQQALVQNNVSMFYDVEKQRVVNTGLKEYVEVGYALGKKLVKLPTPYRVPDAGKVTHVFVNADSVKELPSVVLNRKTGYVPKVNENGFWFVKEFGEEMIDGKMAADQVIRTHRYFDNKADAETYVDQLVQKAMSEEGLTEIQARAKYRSLEDREQEIIATATGDFSHGSGGLYTASRAEDAVLFGLEGTRGQRINAYQALTQNIANVSRMVPINQWRLGLEQRWINTARALTGKDITSFKKLGDSAESTRSGAFLNKMYDQIRDWQGFPSKEEQVYKGTVQQMYEWALRKEWGTGAKLLGWARDKDPIAASRAAAFHSLLGWLNPAQLWVQAQGMSIAVSMNMGKNLTKTLRQTTGLTMLGEGKDLSKGQITLAAKAAGMDANELLNLQKLWEKTGLQDSILQTADHAASIRGHGIAMDALKNTADKGLFFYRRGELLNRRMSFTTAYDEFVTKTGRLNPTDEELKGILDRTHNLMLNLGKANRAQFQKGLMSIPTQFLQVTTKSIETMLGLNGNFTKAERGRIFAGQIALYGTAGIPLASLGVNYLTEVAGFTQEDIDNNPVLVKSINDGFWGFVTLGIFGADLEVSSRGSLLRGTADFIDNWMYSEATVATKLMGAFGSTQQRFWDSFTERMRPITMGAQDPSIIDFVRIPSMSFLESISTWRNAEKALFMNELDTIFSKHGDPSVIRDFNWREVVGAAIGFQTSDEAQVFELTKRSQNVLDMNKKIADLIVLHMNDMVLKEEMGMLDAKALEESDQFYALMYGALDPDRQLDVKRSVQTRLSGDSKQARAIKKYIDKVGVETTDGLSVMQSIFTGTNLQPVFKPEEE